jgi:hypothetical protein
MGERVFLAVPAAVLYGVILYGLVWGVNWSDRAMLFIVGLLFVPMAIASLAVIISDPRGQISRARHAKIMVITVTICIAIALLVLGEGRICAAMAAPFLYLGGLIGTLVTPPLLRRLRTRWISGALVALPLLGLPIELQIAYPDRYSEVRTVMEIDATPEAVWRHTIEIPRIRQDELSWTFSHAILGVPEPVSASMAGSGPGALRQLRWGMGVQFEEIITRWDENRHLAWDFRFSAHSIPPAVESHIKVDSGYLHIKEGDYRLVPLPGGKTRLTLTTRCRMATPINVYAEWWGRLFLNDFHGIVLEIIRARAETQKHLEKLNITAGKIQ